jgi:hypothetical protein
LWSACGTCVEGRQLLWNVPEFSLVSGPGRTGFRKLFGVEGDRGEQVGNYFHFSLPPTVTAGFIGFYFDIRKYSK